MSSNKLEGIQILRAYAAILVVCTHLWSAGRISSILKFGQLGGLGVDIFFIISGFIMCYSIKEKILPYDGLRFLKKRVYRVYPIYIIVLIPFLVEYFWHGSSARAYADPMLAIGNLLLLPSFSGDENYRMLVGPAWTLSYELFFYVLFAGAMFSSTSKNRAICSVMIAIVAMVGLVNFLGLKGARLQWSNFQYIAGDTLLFNFVIGCGCFFVWRKYARALFNFWTAIGVAALLTPTALLLARAGYPRTIGFGLPASAIVLVFLFADFKANVLTKPLLFLGSASYSIYLVQALISHWKHLLIMGVVRENDLTGILLTLGAVAAGSVFYVFVENPISRLFHRPPGRPVSVVLPFGKP